MYLEKNNISCLLTIHNKEFLIGNVVEGLIYNFSDLVKEFVIVFDGCTDNSENIVKEKLKNISKINIKYLYTDDVFEIKANNAGLKQLTGDYALLIQDDMVVKEKLFDHRMLRPFFEFDDIFAVTSNTAHNNYFEGTFQHIDLADKKYGASRDIFYVREIANRGPIMYNLSDLKKLNYLDEYFCPYTYDDHDISYRAKKKLNKVSGLYWIDCLSDPSWGTTRIKNQSLNATSLRNNEIKILERHKDIICNKNKIKEERVLKG